MSQPSLFDWQAARDAALAQVSENAEEHAPGFAERAQAFVLDYLRQNGPASGEAVTDACKAAGIVPHDDRAFGSVYMALSRRGLIRKVGHAMRRKGHGCAGGNIWEAAGA